MPRTITATEEVKREELLHRWERVSGKHHIREFGELKTYVKGDIRIASKGAYTDNPRWKDLGPVGIPKEVPEKNLVFRKEQTKQGWFVYTGNNSKPFNDIPITEQEADELIYASLENK